MQWPEKDIQCNGQKRTDNAMAKKGHTMQWPKKDIQCNGQKRTDNECNGQKGQTMQWPKRTDNAMAKNDRQCNGQKGHKKTNNGRPNTTHKIKD